MAAASARAQKPVGSAAWIAAEKENMTELVNQEMEEVEYPVRHEMAWLNEHMAEIFSKGQANFTDVFKTPGKMRGKTPRTTRKRTVEENRVPLSEIFSSAHKIVENKASPSPFVHRVVSKSTAPTATVTASARPQNAANVSQPQYPDLSQNLNSFSKYNTDSGYHGLTDDDEMVLPATQSDTQVSTQPMEEDEPVSSNSQVDISISQQTTDDSFHSAQENVRARGETVEPANPDPTPTQERNIHLSDTFPKDSEPEMNITPTAKTQPMSKANAEPEKQQDIQGPPRATESKQEDAVVNSKSSPIKPLATQALVTEEPENEDVEMADPAKEDVVLDGFDDIGSPSDGSTPERPLVRKSSLNFASLPAREPLTKSMGGSRLSRTSHIDLSKHNNSNRTSYLGRQIGGHRMTQVAGEDNSADSGAMAIDGEKEDDEDVDAERASKLHNTKSTQSLHERISMLGKLQPSRPKKSIPAVASLSGGQISYPDLPPPKSEARLQSSSPKTRATPAQDRDEDDWIKPLSSQRSNLTKSHTTEVMEKLSEADKNEHNGKSATQEQHTAESERPKSSTSIFSSPRPHGHQQSASTSNIPAEASTTPTGSPRRFDGPLSASKTRLQSIMKTAKGLFTSTGSTARVESSPSEQPRVQSQSYERTNAEMDERKPDRSGSQPRQISSPSPSRQEGRRTRSSTEKEEKRRQREREERQQEEELQQKLREQEKQRAMQLKVAQDKSSVEPEERTAAKPTQSQRQQSREPEPAYAGSRNAAPQSKLNDRRPKPTREPAQMPKPQPVSIRVGSTLSRQVPMASSVSSSMQDNVPASAPAPASRQSNLKKKGSNTSLHTASSNSSFKTSVSSQTQAQRKAHLANERKKEQEERELRRKEEQKRDQERKRAVQQQQEEARRQEMRSRAESERERRELSAQEDPRKAAIKKRQLENARRHERQGSQQANREGPMLQHETSALKSSQQNDLGASRAPSSLGSIQTYSRPINPPAPNPAKPPKRGPEEEPSQRPAVRKPSNVHGTSEGKRLKTDDEPGLMQPVRAPMAPPVRHSNIRKPSLFNQTSMAHPTGSSIFKTAQPQRPAHPMVKYTNSKIPFAEPNQAPPPAAHKPSAPSSVQRVPPQAKPSPKYPSGENIHLPEIATDSEDEDDSDSEMFPVPKWAQPKELEGLLRQQDGMEVDSIFGPIAPFSLEETFKADKKIKKYRDRTSSANWSGPDGLTQEEIKKDRADRQRLRLNGGWSFQN